MESKLSKDLAVEELRKLSVLFNQSRSIEFFELMYEEMATWWSMDDERIVQLSREIKLNETFYPTLAKFRAYHKNTSYPYKAENYEDVE
jgi:hypothetical protein